MKRTIFNLEQIQWKSAIKGSRTKDIIGDEICPYSRMRIVEIQAHASFNSHEHNFIQMLFFAFGGDGKINVGEETYDIRRNLVAVIQPGICHAVRNDSTEKLKIIIFEEKKPDQAKKLPFVDF